MAETAAGEVVVLHLRHQRRPQRLPLGRTLRAPAARSARRAAGEPRRLDQRLDELGDPLPILLAKARGEPDMVEEPLVVIEPEQQRADELAPLAVAKSA